MAAMEAAVAPESQTKKSSVAHVNLWKGPTEQLTYDQNMR